MSTRTSLLDTWRIGNDGEQEEPYFVYCQRDAENTRPGGAIMLCGRYATWREAKQGTIHAILDFVSTPWCLGPVFAAFIEDVAALAGVSQEEAKARIDRARAISKEGGPHYICPMCWTTSCNPNDLAHGFCARCKGWTSEGPEPVRLNTR